MDFIQVLLLFGLFNISALEALKCATDDGVTDEEVRKIAQVCVKKAANSYEGNSHNNFNGNLNNKEDDRIDFLQQRNMQRNKNRWNTRYRNENQFGDDQYYGNTNGSVASNQNTGHQANRSCIFHCFFQEMGMLKKDEFPDKHKVLHALTNDIRDREIRNFYVDTIQECFMHLEMQQKTDKCQFSNNLVNCMVDYGRANCDDWQEHTTIFM